MEWFRNFILGFCAIIVAIVIVLGLGLLLTFPLMWAWNYTMPYLFNLPIINFWRMFSLYFVLSILWKVSVIKIKEK